ncbi:hypothetical protein MUK42_34514 [Musa troglodytarum]|uniref:Uncharacterized protein n=1 Tax=Musa troglodytarum TaxID=320322 RepID=A0A9E7FEI3_9LILI|nr:hypothetical protein MUK42_34514 [Musa troglodytarum]
MNQQRMRMMIQQAFLYRVTKQRENFDEHAFPAITLFLLIPPVDVYPPLMAPTQCFLDELEAVSKVIQELVRVSGCQAHTLKPQCLKTTAALRYVKTASMEFFFLSAIALPLRT